MSIVILMSFNGGFLGHEESRLITVYTENSSLWSRVLVYTVNSRGVHGPLVPLLFTVGTGTMR